MYTKINIYIHSPELKLDYISRTNLHYYPPINYIILLQLKFFANIQKLISIFFFA